MFHTLGPKWSVPDFEQRLKERLSDSYDSCITSIELIRETVVEIKKELGVDDTEFQARLANPVGPNVCSNPPF